jgi:carbamoyltransferase
VSVALGLNFHHDTSAALIVDGHLYAAEEERWSGLKHHRAPGGGKGMMTLPDEALAWCLDAAGVDPADIDTVWTPAMRPDPPGGTWLSTEREELAALLPAQLGRRLQLLSHHTAHVLAGYLMSGHEHAAGLVIDGGGSSLGADLGPGRERISGYDLHPDRIERIQQLPTTLTAGPRGVQRTHHSLGHLYRNLALRTIPPGDEPEGSMMALAALGDPDRFGPALRDLIHLGDEGQIRITHPWGSRDHHTALPLTHRQWTVAGIADIPLHDRADLAAAAQQVFAQAVVHVARHLRQLTGARDLVFSGGCALNAHLNGHLAHDSGFDTLFVAPAPHDAGTAVGAALYAWTYQLGQPPLPTATGAAWGPEPGELSADAVPDGYSAVRGLGPRLVPTVAALLAKHHIVGWVQGPMEFGPRALGQRSVLAHPGRASTATRLNAIKQRAGFRPFAPAVLVEHLAEWFDGDADPFMNRVVHLRPECRDRIPAVTHHDGTARAQALAPGSGPLRELLQEFHQRTLIPLLLNTSLNLKGTPILRTSDQAAQAMSALRLDALVVGDTLLFADHVTVPDSSTPADLLVERLAR